MTREDTPDDEPLELTAIDLFAGAGGLSLAFHKQGFTIVAAVEHGDDEVATYKQAFVRQYSRATRVVHEDIRSKSVLPALGAALNGRPLDVMIGGPPCQDFSPACKRRRADRMDHVNDYLKILAQLRPRAFLFENVPSLLSADDGSHWKTLQTGFADLGYEVQFEVLDAQNFGVPQRRRRLFVVGVPFGASFQFPRRRPHLVPVGEVFKKWRLPTLAAGEEDPDDPAHRARAHRKYMVDYFALIPVGGSWRDATDSRVLPCHVGHNGHYDVYGRIDPACVAPTMTGGCTNPSKGRFIHPEQDRGLTVREAALLQTFPRRWQFSGGIESQSQQVGNAVPVRLGEALAKHVHCALRSQVQGAGAKPRPTAIRDAHVA